MAELYVYPVKSAGGIRLEAVDLDALGPVFDRRWMVVDGEGRFLTQRRLPRMALIQPVLGDGVLELRTTGVEDLSVPLEPGNGVRQGVEIWEDEVTAERVSPRADAWLSRVLGVPVHLVRLDESGTQRAADPAGAPGAGVGFADQYPLLLLSRGSVDGLNRRLERPVGVDRFRPNVVVDGVLPHEEDRWRRIRVGEVPFSVVRPCRRCSVPGVDQATGVPGKEPLRALAGYRRGEGTIWFGQNVVHHGSGRIAVGDRVEVLEDGPPRPGPEIAPESMTEGPSGRSVD